MLPLNRLSRAKSTSKETASEGDYDLRLLYLDTEGFRGVYHVFVPASDSYLRLPPSGGALQRQKRARW